MAYAIAAYHDTGLVESRETHHVASARIVREDKHLLQWFTPEQIEVMAQAEKYAEGGYLKLWIAESPNGERLAQLRAIIRDSEQMRQVFEQLWMEPA